MSALTCGCDDAAGWICEQHRPAIREMLADNEPTRDDLENRAAVNEILGSNYMSAKTARFDGKLPKWERLDRAERFKGRLAAAYQMTDTTASAALSNVYAHDEPMPKSPAEQFRAEAVAVADAVQTRDDLLNRIATLEQQNARLQERMAVISHDYRYLMEMERHDRSVNDERIAAILATFYRAELSISSTQPIIALALELNPDLVERAR